MKETNEADKDGASTGVVLERIVMRRLLQNLWDEYNELVKEVERFAESESTDDGTRECLRDIISDTNSMNGLRDKLFYAGIKRIPGKTQEDIPGFEGPFDALVDLGA